MACFVIPATEAIITTVAAKIIEKKEMAADNSELTIVNKELFSTKLKRLNKMLWGGSALLAFEHLWHGEIQPFFPFLTAAANEADAVNMLHEMSTVGVTMALLVTIVWGISNVVIARNTKEEKA